MHCTQIPCALLLAAAIFSVAGCGDGAKEGTTATRARRSLGSDKVATAATRSSTKSKRESVGKGSNQYTAADVSLSPEASMKRDMNRLKDKYDEQEKTVKEMRTALAQGQDIVSQEEKRLHEIRGQIDQYHSALQQYEVAAASSRSPEKSSGKTAQRQPQSVGVATAKTKIPTQTRRSDGPEEYMAMRPAQSDYGDEVIYDSGSQRVTVAYGGAAEAPAQRNFDLSQSSPYAAAASSRDPGYDMESRYASSGDAFPGSGSSNSNTRRSDWNAPTSMYGAAPGSSIAMVPQPNQSQQVRPAPAPAPVTVQPTQVAKANSLRPDGMSIPGAGAVLSSDDVFTPDLILTGGK